MELDFIKTLLVILFLPKRAFQLDSSSGVVDDMEILHREKRQVLLYPYSTVLQLNIGVGTPTPVKTIQVNWAIQANFQLPWNLSQIPANLFYSNARSDDSSRTIRESPDFDNKIEDDKENYEFENESLRPQEDDEFRLHHLYKNVEEILTGYGYNGPICVRQVLCQIAGDPLYPHDEEDLLHEIADFLLNPNHDIDDSDLSANDEAFQYIEAYDTGLKSEDCLKKYDGCSLSLLDMFSKLY